MIACFSLLLAGDGVAGSCSLGDSGLVTFSSTWISGTTFSLDSDSAFSGFSGFSKGLVSISTAFFYSLVSDLFSSFSSYGFSGTFSPDVV